MDDQKDEHGSEQTVETLVFRCSSCPMATKVNMVAERVTDGASPVMCAYSQIISMFRIVFRILERRNRSRGFNRKLTIMKITPICIPETHRIWLTPADE